MTLLNRKTDFFLLLITCWIISIKDVAGLKLNRLIIDTPVKNGSSIWLHCDFQLDKGEQRAFTSKFYKNNIEFYRYSISSDHRSKPSKKFFTQPARNVNISRSNGSHVFLQHIEPSTEGTFSCEINTDEPFFMSMQAQQDLRVYVLPTKRLQLINLKDNYREGDLVNIQCKSSASKPPIVLRWHINNQQIYKNEENLNVTYQTLDQDSINGLSSTSSNLTFYLCTNTSSVYNNNLRTNNLRARKQCSRRGRIGQLLKQSNNGLFVRCSGVLSQITMETSEELIIEEKGQNSRYEQSGNSDDLQPPKIQGLNLRYQIGDQLQLNCSSNGHSLPPYLEWFVNNRRINEQYVHNYYANTAAAHTNDHSQQTFSLPFTGIEQNSDLKTSRPLKQHTGHLITNSFERMPESNLQSKSPSLSKSSHSRSTANRKSVGHIRKAATDEQRSHEVEFSDKGKDFQNDYLFSSNLKKLNLLSFQQRSKNNSNNFSLANSISHNNLVGQALQSDSNSTLSLLMNQSNLTSLVNTFHQQTLYNNNVNLTSLQNIIYQHYADYSFRPAQHKIGIRFRVMKKHYQTLDFALRVRCVATYGKILWQDQSTVALFADGRTSQFNALEISSSSAALGSYSSFVSVILILIVHLINNNGFIKR